MMNYHKKTVAGFGDEWRRFDQSSLPEQELQDIFSQYFKIFPWHLLSTTSIGFDLGCGSGRWAKIVAERIGKLHCIDASDEALAVARKNLKEQSNCIFHHASVDTIPIDDCSMDFGYSLGVLHHVPDTLEGIKACVAKLKPGAPFLLYLYYAFDNRPPFYITIWNVSNLFRKLISRTPVPVRYLLSQILAVLVYLPLARIALALNKLGFSVESFPLASYRNRSFYTMRTDALDRFGTIIEKRFTAEEIKKMMEEAGLEKIVFSDSPPYWCSLGYKHG